MEGTNRQCFFFCLRLRSGKASRCRGLAFNMFLLMAKTCFWGPARIEWESLWNQCLLWNFRSWEVCLVPLAAGQASRTWCSFWRTWLWWGDQRGVKCGLEATNHLELRKECCWIHTLSLYSTFHIYIRFLTHSHVQFDTGFSFFSKWVNGFSWPRRCLGSIFVAFLLAPATTPLQVGWKDRSLPGRHEHFCKGSSPFQCEGITTSFVKMMTMSGNTQLRWGGSDRVIIST